MKTYINFKTLLLCTTFFFSSCSRSPFTSAFYVRNAVNTTLSPSSSFSTPSSKLHIIALPWSPTSFVLACDSNIYYIIPPKDVHLPIDTINE